MKLACARTVLAVFLLLRAAGAFALPPDDVKKFPAYPKAALVKNTAGGASAEVTYASPAAAGKVLAWYVDAFGLRPAEAGSEFAPLQVWNAAGVQCMVFFAESATPTFTWAKGAATGGMFQWTSEDGRGNSSSFNMNITDTGGAGTEIALVVITANKGEYEAQQEALGAEMVKGAAAIEQGFSEVNPVQEKIVNDLKAHPPSQKEMAALIKKEYGVPLYPGATIEMKAMEIYMMTLFGGVEGYWFLARNAPDTVVAFYEKATGNHAYQKPLDISFYIDITDARRLVTGRISVYLGTAAMLLNQEETEDIDPDDLNISTIGFFKGDDVGKPPESEAEGGR
jgi:hypothetical protein